MAKATESKAIESKAIESKAIESKAIEKKLLVALKCRYGKYMPNDKVSLPKNEAERLLSLDAAKKA